MIPKPVIKCIATGLVCIAFSWVATQGFADPVEHDYNIPAESAAASLREFSSTSGIEVLYVADAVQGVTTKAVQGSLTAPAALLAMLEGTPLQAFQDLQTGGFSVQRRQLEGTRTSSPFGAVSSDSGQQGVAAKTIRPASLNSNGTDIVNLNPFEVSAENQGYVGSETTSGAKVKTAVFTVPQTISVVTRGFIDDAGAVNMTQAIQLAVPGATAYGAPSPFSGITIRGFRAQFWAIDGATTNSSGPLNTYDFDGIEVIKGPSALLYGPFGAYGGYVNLIPKWAHRDAKNIISTEIGTDNYSSSMLDLSHSWLQDGRFQSRVVVGYLHMDRPGITGDYTHNFTFAPSFNYDINDASKIRFRMAWNRQDFLQSNVPMGTNGEPMREASANRWFTDNNISNRDLVTQTEFITQINDAWSARVQFLTENTHYQGTSGDFINGSYPSNGTFGIYRLYSNYSAKSWYFDATLAWDARDIGHGISNNLVINTNINNWNERYYNYNSTNLTFLYPQYNMPPWTTVSIFSGPQKQIGDKLVTDQNYLIYPYAVQWLGGAMASDTLSVFNGKLKLIFGTRYNYDERYSYLLTRTIPNAPMTGNPSTAVVNALFLNRYGAVYEIHKHVNIYYGHDEGYLAAGDAYRYDGSRIGPETGVNDEIGIKFDALDVPGGTIFGSISYFKLDVNDKWRSDMVHTGFYITDGHQENKGLDAQIAYTTSNGKLSIVSGMYVADGPRGTDTGGLRAVNVPKTTANIWAKYDLTSAISIGGGWRYQGTSLDSGRLFNTPAFQTIDLFAKYRYKPTSIKGAIEYRLGISNLTDKNAAYEAYDSARLLVIEGRQIKLSASYIW